MSSDCGVLTVIVPAHNEAASLGPVIAEIAATRATVAELGMRLEICVIDDGSTDQTGRLAREAGADRLVVHAKNLGLGAAVRAGLAQARDRESVMAVKIDADGQHNPSDIPAVIAPILRDEADIVYGNRFPKISYRMPWMRRWGNRAFCRIMRWLTGWDIADSQPGFFAVNRAYLRGFVLPGNYNDTQQILLDANHRGLRFAQVDIDFCKRESGDSFISLRYPFAATLQILVLLAFARPLKVFMPVSAVFLGSAGIIFCLEVVTWLAGGPGRPVEHPNLVLGLGIFGLNAAFFGLLAELIVQSRRTLLERMDRPSRTNH